MTPEQRVEAMNHDRLTQGQLLEWSRRRPDEVPKIGGEFAWLVRQTADWAETLQQVSRARALARGTAEGTLTCPPADWFLVWPRRYPAHVPRTLVEPSPVFTVKGRICRSETRQRTASAYMLEFSTVLTDHGVHVESVYVAGERTHTQVTDLYIAGDEEILATRTLEQLAILGPLGWLRCLRDHAEHVETFLISLGYADARVELDAASAPK